PSLALGRVAWELPDEKRNLERHLAHLLRVPHHPCDDFGEPPQLSARRGRAVSGYLDSERDHLDGQPRDHRTWLDLNQGRENRRSGRLDKSSEGRAGH